MSYNGKELVSRYFDSLESYLDLTGGDSKMEIGAMGLGNEYGINSLFDDFLPLGSDL